MRTIPLRAASVRTAAAATSAIAVLAAAPAAASAPTFSVRYDGRLAVTTATPYMEGGVGLVTIKPDSYAAVPITVTSDTAADISIFPMSDKTTTDKTLPPGVTTSITGPGCAPGANTVPSQVPGWGCKVTPGTQTFTATVFISADSSLAKTGKSVMIISYLDFHNGGPSGYGGYINVGVASAPPSPPPTTPTPHTTTPPRTTTAPPTRTSAAAPPALTPPAPSSSTPATTPPTTAAATSASTPPTTPSAPTPSTTPDSRTPSADTSTLTAEPTGHSRSSVGTPIALGAAAAAAAAAALAVFLIRRRAASTDTRRSR